MVSGALLSSKVGLDVNVISLSNDPVALCNVLTNIRAKLIILLAFESAA